MVEETYLPGMSVSLVARQHGVGANQLLTWRRLMSQGALTAATAGKEVVTASDYRALEAQVAELHNGHGPSLSTSTGIVSDVGGLGRAIP